jgi:hypothetical protein
MTDTLSARPDTPGLDGAARNSAPLDSAGLHDTAPDRVCGQPAGAERRAVEHSLERRGLAVPGRPTTAAEAAAWYALRLGWPVVPGSPVLAVLGQPVPGAVRLGVVDAPALVGTAALERVAKAPEACGPVTDGQGRIRFLVDLGDQDSGERVWLEDWRAAGVDLQVTGAGGYCPLPTPGMVGRSRVVWSMPPDPCRPALPRVREVTAVLDRAVRDAYPALWDVPTRCPS